VDVILAGLNVDAELLREFPELLERARQALAPDAAAADRAALAAELAALAERRNLTPETLSAAYARISRDPRPAPELRAAARAEVDRARRSNETIIFGLGHASVAEHAVFNLDVLGISRLAAEFVERFRLCSYTEKSQRYITLTGDYVTPVEVLGTPLEAEFHALVARQVAFYHRCYGKLAEYFPTLHPELAGAKDGRRTLDGWAKEDARYGLSLATETQLGLTANARNLERIIQAAAAHPLGEVREYGDRLRRAVGGIAPSLIKYTEPAAHHRLDLPLTRELLETLGVPVLGYGTDEFPAFYSRTSGLAVDGRVDTPEDVVRVIEAKRDLELDGGVLVVNPVPEADALDAAVVAAAVERAQAEADARGIRGKDLTPFLLARVAALTGGASLAANRSLLRHNARLAGRLAVALHNHFREEDDW